MKNQSRFDAFIAMAIAASGSMAQSMRKMAERPQLAYHSRRTATAKPKNNPAGTKLLKAIEKHNLGLGIHRNSKHPIEGITFSPKKDIGKGPAQTLSKRERQLLTGQKRITQRHHYYNLATTRNLEAKLRYL